MKQHKLKEPLLAELDQMQKELKKTLRAYKSFIKQFQLLVENESMHMQVIEQFSCPVAIFKKGGVICIANRILFEETDLKADDIAEGRSNFLSRVTDENYSVLEAAEGVFYGRTALLSQLSYPLEMFCRSWSFDVSNNYQSALLFPLPDKEANISLGVIMLLK